jgi:hypothetical protein
MGQAGFVLVLNYGSGSSDNAQPAYLAYLDRARQDNIRVIWDFHALAWEAGGAERAAAVVAIVKDHPATWGYYVGDENPANQSQDVLALAEAIKAADPGHPRLYVGERTVDQLALFAPSAEYLGLDVYRIGSSDYSTAMVDEVGTAARALRTFNGERGKRTTMVLQAFNWQDDPSVLDWDYLRWPTREEMRAMRDQAADDSQADMILWFAYYHAGKPGAESHWEDLKWAAFGDQ